MTLLLISHTAYGQDDLMGDLEEMANPEHFNSPAFKAMKIVNLQSTKVAAKGDLYMYVSHRFGTLKDGTDTFFGLDNANTKLQLVYGMTERIQLGLSRESFRKTYAASMKVKVATQSKKMPINISGYLTINSNAQLSDQRYPFLVYSDRLSYATQLLLARRLSQKISLELAPSYIRQNVVWETGQRHDQYALGMGGRYKLSKRTTLNFDYVHNFSRKDNSLFRNPLSFGIDIETGGHVFQLLFTNAQSTNEPALLSNAGGDWADGDIFFGFNIVRVF